MRVLSEATAAWLQRLMTRETGRVVTTPPDPQGGKYIPPMFNWLYVASATAIDTSVTDPSLTKDYYNAVVTVFSPSLETWTNGDEVYVTTAADTGIGTGYLYAVCVGKQTIDDATKILYMPIGGGVAGASTITLTRCVRLVSA